MVTVLTYQNLSMLLEYLDIVVAMLFIDVTIYIYIGLISCSDQCDNQIIYNISSMTQAGLSRNW